MRSEPAAVERFWAWFAAEAGGLLAKYKKGDDAVPANAITRELHRIDDRLNWEMGPWGSITYFAITPNGRRKLLDGTRAIVSRALEVEGWAFLAAKPPKKWTRRIIEMRGESGGPRRRIDLDSWRFVFQDRGEGMNVVLTAPDVDDLEESDTRILGWLLLDSELGEEVVMAQRLAPVVIPSAPTRLRGEPLPQLEAWVAALRRSR